MLEWKGTGVHTLHSQVCVDEDSSVREVKVWYNGEVMKCGQAQIAAGKSSKVTATAVNE